MKNLDLFSMVEKIFDTILTISLFTIFPLTSILLIIDIYIKDRDIHWIWIPLYVIPAYLAGFMLGICFKFLIMNFFKLVRKILGMPPLSEIEERLKEEEHQKERNKNKNFINKSDQEKLLDIWKEQKIQTMRINKTMDITSATLIIVIFTIVINYPATHSILTDISNSIGETFEWIKMTFLAISNFIQGFMK